MSHSTTELFSRNFFRRNGFNNGRTGDEHLAGVFNHVNEVCQSRRINGTACAWSHDYGNLRNYAGSIGISLENSAVTGKCVNGFLNTSPAGIIDTNARSTHFQGHFLYFPDFFSVHFAKGTTFYSEVLSVSIHQTAVYSTVTCDNAFSRQVFLFLAKVSATMFYKLI